MLIVVYLKGISAKKFRNHFQVATGKELPEYAINSFLNSSINLKNIDNICPQVMKVQNWYRCPLII